MHTEPSKLADQIVQVNLGSGNEKFLVKDWWDRLYGKSWSVSEGNPAAMEYAIRGGLIGVPIDDEVLYGHSVRSGLGHLIHVTEIRED